MLRMSDIDLAMAIYNWLSKRGYVFPDFIETIVADKLADGYREVEPDMEVTEYLNGVEYTAFAGRA